MIQSVTNVEALTCILSLQKMSNDFILFINKKIFKWKLCTCFLYEYENNTHKLPTKGFIYLSIIDI